MKLSIYVSFEHLVYLDDVGVCFGAQELVPSPVEAENKPTRAKAGYSGRFHVVGGMRHRETVGTSNLKEVDNGE